MSDYIYTNRAMIIFTIGRGSRERPINRLLIRKQVNDYYPDAAHEKE